MPQEQQSLLKRLLGRLFKQHNIQPEPIIEKAMTAEEKEAHRQRKLELMISSMKRVDFGPRPLKTFKAPNDDNRFNEFFASYQALGWDWKTAIVPYKDDYLIGYNLFHDETTDAYTHSIRQLFFNQNGVRVRLTDDCEDDFNQS